VLLLLDTVGTGTYLQHTVPDPIFVAWVRMIPKVVLGVVEAGRTAERYYNAIQRDPSAVLQLPPLNLEHPGLQSYAPAERFQLVGGEPDLGADFEQWDGFLDEEMFDALDSGV
jgi:hypothetical protein